MAMLRRIEIKGYRSIKEASLELRALNVLIGANGAGKSNLVSFFKMLNEMMAGRLQEYIGRTGRGQSLLHFGPKVTPQIEASLEFEEGDVIDTYAMRLFHAANDTLLFGIGRRTRYEKVRKFILNTIKQREGKNVYFTTLVDLYGLPHDFPGKAANMRVAANPTAYVLALEKAFQGDIDHFRFSDSFPIFSFTSTRPFCSPIQKHFASRSRTAKRKLSSSRQSLPRRRASST
jgi:AAA ATPase domain